VALSSSSWSTLPWASLSGVPVVWRGFRYEQTGTEDGVATADLGDGAGSGAVATARSMALNREGWKVGKKLAYRLYREEGLTLRHKAAKRRVAMHCRARFRPTPPNKLWSMDFVADQLADGRRFRTLTILDVFTRESLAMNCAF
jgi:transposase InsO family protein